MTVGTALRYFRTQVAPVAGACALREAEEALEWLLGCSRQELYLSSSRLLDYSTVETLKAIISRRKKREPLAYILGRAYFYSRYFKVSPAVLVPRLETEILVETVLKREPQSACRFLDVGTGSGAIVATLLEARPQWWGVGIDISLQALSVALANSPASCRLVCCDMFSALSCRSHFDFIVSNPPYVDSGEIDKLDPEIRDYEPRLAIDGGPDGLRFLGILATEAAARLVEGGRLYCEIGDRQREAATTILTAAGWRSVLSVDDLCALPRVIIAVKG